MTSRNSSRVGDEDVGAPLPDFRASGIQLQTVAPALGVTGLGGSSTPDYLDYDPKGRGMVVTMFANTGMAYLMGISSGGMYGLREALLHTPSTRFRVKLNAVLNQCGRYGARYGNTLGTFALIYSFYEGVADQWDLDNRLGVRNFAPSLASSVAPAFGSAAASATYFAPSGLRVAALAGTLGLGAVVATYSVYAAVGIPIGSGGFLFF